MFWLNIIGLSLCFYDYVTAGSCKVRGNASDPASGSSGSTYGFTAVP